MQTYFEFDEKIYEQKRGTPLGSLIRGFIAKAVMRKVESIAIAKFNHELWLRYVDDVYTIVKNTDMITIHKTLDNVFEGIQFTVEGKEDHLFPFLDVEVRRAQNSQLETYVYRERTHTDQILNYTSYHPKSHRVA